MARYLISAGADMEASAWFDMTPFLSSAANGNRELMEVLIENGCNIRAEGSYGEALAYASVWGHLGIAKRLIELGLDVNHKSNRGNTSLHWACRWDYVEISEYLLSVGADIEAVNFEGRTPFLVAIGYGNGRVMNFLILKGCNIYAQDKRNRGAIEIAHSKNRVSLKEKLVNIFSEREATSSTDKEITADKREEAIPKPEAEETTLRADSKSFRSSPTISAFVLGEQTLIVSSKLQSRHDRAEKERNIANSEKESLAELVQELQRRLDKSEKKSITACTEKESLTEDLRSSQHLVQELQRLVEEEKAFSRATERNLHSSQQFVRDLQKEKDTILSEHKEKMTEVEKASQYLRERIARAETDIRRMSERSAQLEQERDEARLVAQEAQRNLSQYESVHQFSSPDVIISDVKLGGGSHGDVRVGRWRGCNVAVKTFFDFLRVDEYLRRLEQEISICSQVHHPNIVSLLGVITQDGIPLRLVSELLEASLSDIIAVAGGRLSLREQVDVAVGCSSGICYLHGLGILHGDIRSTNVVVTSLMQAKICDLGAARFSEVSSLSAGLMSPDYIAPERLKLGEHNTKMADVYSLGVTFIELMTGEKPAPRKRMTQGTSVNHPSIRRLGLRMVDPICSNRPLATDCLARLEGIQASDEEYKCCPAKRMVKGKVYGGEKVELVGEPWS
ncbi:uncharacterized protein [Oscarella lobularis]